jgi:hypothetical protein
MKNGKIINVNADGIQWWNESRMLQLYNNGDTVGMLNIDNIAGWVKTNHMVEKQRNKDEGR